VVLVLVLLVFSGVVFRELSGRIDFQIVSGGAL